MKPAVPRILVLLIALGALSPAICRADACANLMRFRLDSEGPWPQFGRTRRNTPCTSWFLSSGSTVYKRLLLTSQAEHGKVSLTEGGYFTYTPAAGYEGTDRFRLRVCGLSQTQAYQCANLDFSISVTP